MPRFWTRRPAFGPDEVASGAAQFYVGTVATAPSYALFPTDAYWREPC